jgi:hypothetical protein
VAAFAKSGPPKGMDDTSPTFDLETMCSLGRSVEDFQAIGIINNSDAHADRRLGMEHKLAAFGLCGLGCDRYRGAELVAGDPVELQAR